MKMQTELSSFIANAEASDPTPAGAIARWQELHLDYEQARDAADEYDRTVWTPDYERAEAGGPEITDFVIAEMERLIEIRSVAEDALMDWPSPDAGAFAIKYLVARGAIRKSDRWDVILEDDARRLAAPSPLHELLAQRDALLRAVNHRAGPMPGEVADGLIAAACAIERTILKTPAGGREDLFAKAMILAGRVATMGRNRKRYARAICEEAIALQVMAFAE
jgi:hypothetical protein